MDREVRQLKYRVWSLERRVSMLERRIRVLEELLGSERVEEALVGGAT